MWLSALDVSSSPKGKHCQGNLEFAVSRKRARYCDVHSRERESVNCRACSSMDGSVSNFQLYNYNIIPYKIAAGCTLPLPPLFHGGWQGDCSTSASHVTQQPTWRTKTVRLACMLKLNVLRDSPDILAVFLESTAPRATRDRFRGVLGIAWR